MPVSVLVTASQQVLSSEQDSTVLALSVPRAKRQSLPQCVCGMNMLTKCWGLLEAEVDVKGCCFEEKKKKTDNVEQNVGIGFNVAGPPFALLDGPNDKSSLWLVREVPAAPRGWHCQHGLLAGKISGHFPCLSVFFFH